MNWQNPASILTGYDILAVRLTELIPAFHHARIEVLRPDPFVPELGTVDQGLVLNIGRGMDEFAAGVEYTLIAAEVLPERIGRVRIFPDSQLRLRIGRKMNASAARTNSVPVTSLTCIILSRE